jgi:PPOX class probable FMN-dependent enzyme
VLVQDDHTLLLPDWPGNNRLDSLTNILDNPRVGLLFLIPGVNETLRVNGTAEIRNDEALRTPFHTGGQLPATVLRVTVLEAFLHCSKAFMRSGLWQEESKLERSRLPTLGQMINDQTGNSDAPETQEAMEARYRKNLY